MVPFCLGEIEREIRSKFSEHNNMIRMGRKYIINYNSVFHMNAIKQTVSLSDSHGQVITLNVSKPALRSLMQQARNSYSTIMQGESVDFNVEAKTNEEDYGGATPPLTESVDDYL